MSLCQVDPPAVVGGDEAVVGTPSSEEGTLYLEKKTRS